MRIKSGDTVFVSGGGGGIGLAVAEVCAARGANLVLADVFADRLAATVAAFKGPVHGVVMDVRKEEDWTRARAEAETRFGQVDVLVQSAGNPPCTKLLLDTSLEEFKLRIDTHLIGMFLGLRTFGPPMRERGRGHIVNLSSEAGLSPWETLGDYGAAKYGIVGMTEILRLELASAGVGVTVVAPGLTRSNMTIGMGMEARFVGEAIVKGIEDDRAYVITHASARARLEQRFQAILDAVGESADPGYDASATKWS